MKRDKYLARRGSVVGRRQLRSFRRAARTGWRRWLPGLSALSRYQRDWLWSDLVAGFILAAITVPVGIAYAVAAGLPGIYGLYATIVPFLVYAVFGPSRHLVIAPSSAMTGIIMAVVLTASEGDPAYAVALASTMALVSGAVCAVAGIARLGFVTELLSKPIRYGFINGIAMTVMASQVPALFGVTVAGDGTVARLYELGLQVAAGNANGSVLAVGTSVLVFILLFRRRDFPAVFVSVILATIAGAAFDLGRYGVELLGPLPSGLPVPVIPLVKMSDLGVVLLGGLAAAVYSLSSTSVLSRSFSSGRQNATEADAEMVAVGASNLVSGFFQGFPVTASTSRTPLVRAIGAKSQLAAVFAALIIMVLITVAPHVLQTLPESALAAVVIAIAASIIEIKPLKRIYKIQRWEFWLSIACLVGVIVLGPVQGIGLAIFIAMVEFLWSAWRPHYAVLGRAKGVKGYHDIKRYPDAHLYAGLVLFRWDAPLFFANAEWFHELVLEAVDDAVEPVHWLVVAAEPVTNIDITAADMLVGLEQTLRDRQIKLCFAEMKDPVKDTLKRFGLFSRFGEDAFFPTLGQAVSTFRLAQLRTKKESADPV